MQLTSASTNEKANNGRQQLHSDLSMPVQLRSPNSIPPRKRVYGSWPGPSWQCRKQAGSEASDCGRLRLLKDGRLRSSSDVMKTMERSCDGARPSAVTTQSTEDQEILHQISRKLEEIALQLTWFHRSQRTLDERLEKIEQSLLFRIVRWPGAKYARIQNVVGRWLRRSDPDTGSGSLMSSGRCFPAGKNVLVALRRLLTSL